MHMCWLGGHFDEEYTPSEYLRRPAKASFSVIRLPSRRKTASVSATSRNPRPRTRSEPCLTTAARSASRCSAAQRGASPVASIRSIGGFPGRRSTLSSEVGDKDDISISFQPVLLIDNPGGSALAVPPTRSLAGTPGSPLRSRGLTRVARSLLLADLSPTSVARSARIA